MSPTIDYFIAPVRKSVTVKASQQHAFEVFTQGFDSWWPRSHHIGSSPMTRAVIECFAGGRAYSEQTDGTQCDWGQILVWEPPQRFVLAWKISAQWKYEPDLSKSSEVEITFIPEPDGRTRVDLEHRHFERMGPAGETMRQGVDSPRGWCDLLSRFVTRAERI